MEKLQAPRNFVQLTKTQKGQRSSFLFEYDEVVQGWPTILLESYWLSLYHEKENEHAIL